MTNQEAYNIVRDHLLAQNEQCLDSGGRSNCLYRNHRGQKCAFGALIPDELYFQNMEETNIDTILENYPSMSKHLSGVNTDMLSELQTIHDYKAVEEWEERLKETAERFNLTP